MSKPEPNRHKDSNWKLPEKDDKGCVPISIIELALLMDLRDELKTLNKTLREASIFVNGKVGDRP